MMDNGILTAGYNIDSMKVRLYDGQTHCSGYVSPSHSGCVRRKVSKLPSVIPVLLEPIMKLEVVSPDEYTEWVSVTSQQKGLA